MRVRTALSAFAAVTVVGLGLAPAAPAVAAPGAVSHQVSVQAADGLDIHRGKFMTLGGCQTAGQQGIDRGHWDRYQCAEGSMWPWTWNLWTNR
ncbi:hypothetical protein I3F58_11535 [Streptomyces sp. MUM 203J]|uniref:hypothetical protein n=1 Tax=Streptomyces sp. MUM 203J TaxID=2791990 RepID=UPI001F04A087|nr:hypothetical protein [Streptomyces sp. MUM 203J]MCH0540190.1 hypothetical protein [Streptomyces sp. MUM 203J]